MAMQLKGKKVLVTGAARRGGRAIALELKRRDADVAWHYHTLPREALQIDRTFRADLSRMSDVEKLAAQVEKTLGPIDLLINNAACFFKTPLARVTEKEWDRLLDTNLKGPFFLARRIGLRMKRQKRGVIVNIADWAGLHPYKEYLPYSLSKAGLITMTRGLARILGPEVKVIAVAPKVIDDFPRFARFLVDLLEKGRYQNGATYSVDGKKLVG